MRRCSQALLALAAIFLLASAAPAAAIYQYAGDNYTDIFNDAPPAGTYTTSMSVTGSFTLASPLAMGETDISGLVTSYVFNDGRSTLTEGNSQLAEGSTFFVDGVGDITTWSLKIWEINLAAGDWVPIITLYTTFDQANIGVCGAVNASGECTYISEDELDRGYVNYLARDPTTTWNVTVAPIPASVWLFGSALGFLGWARRRRNSG